MSKYTGLVFFLPLTGLLAQLILNGKKGFFIPGTSY